MPKHRKVGLRTKEKSVNRNCYRIENNEVEHRRQNARRAILTIFKF